jgi:protein-disulfide isomerase
MPSGKKSKQARRAAASAPPPVQSKGSPRRRQADPKLLAIGGGALALIAVIVVLVVVLTGGNSNNTALKDLPAVGSCASGLPGCSDVAAMYKGIPQQGNVLGQDTAPVTLVEYIDLQCPFCQEFETTVFPNILTKYVKTGKVKVEVRPLDFIGPDSSRGRNAMIAAADQNKAFQFAELMYFNQKRENTGWLNDAMVGQVAASIPGLKVQQLLSDRNSGSVKSRAKEYDRQQTADQVTGTPTLFVGKSGAKKLKQVPLASSTDEQSLVDAIENALPSS